MDIKKLREEMNNLTEDEFVDDFDDTEINNDSFTDIDEPVSDVSVTDELDAKTKISRALDVLKDAVEDFKTTTAEEIDLVKDANISMAIEQLDSTINTMTQELTGNKEQVEPMDVTPSEELEEVPQDDEEDNDELVDFDTEAELDLLGTKDEETENED